MSSTSTKKNVDYSGHESIEVIGAREHNLKNISVALPRNQFIVITGISGSGKSSLAFDTIYAEGQRRYMESFSAYARSFIGNLERPDVDKINGRYSNGDLRFHAFAFRARRRSFLIPNRRANDSPIGRPDS